MPAGPGPPIHNPLIGNSTSLRFPLQLCYSMVLYFMMFLREHEIRDSVFYKVVVLSSQSLDLLNHLGRCSQVVVAILSNMDIIFDANSTDSPVSLQSIHINIPLEIGVLEERLNDETAEINL